MALFIDGSNLYAAAKSLGFDIDYKLLRQEFMRRGKLPLDEIRVAILDEVDRMSDRVIAIVGDVSAADAAAIGRAHHC